MMVHGEVPGGGVGLLLYSVHRTMCESRALSEWVRDLDLLARFHVHCSRQHSERPWCA
jgi:hypothetical protein